MAGGISGVIGGSSIPLKSSLCMLSFLSIILYYILPKISHAHTPFPAYHIVSRLNY